MPAPRPAHLRDGLALFGLVLLIGLTVAKFATARAPSKHEIAAPDPAIYNPAAAWSDFKRHILLKMLTTVWFLAVLAACAYGIAATWNEWWPYTALDILDLDSKRPAIYTFIGGAIGATLYAFHGFCVAAGPQRPEIREYHYDPNWTWWYIAWPAVGAFVGAVSYAVVSTGVAAIGEPDNDTKSKTAYFAISALAGLSSREALTWLGSKASGLFASPSATDAPNATDKKTTRTTTPPSRPAPTNGGESRTT